MPTLSFSGPLDGSLQGCHVYWGYDWYTQNSAEIVRGRIPGRVSVWPLHTLCCCGGMTRLVCTAQQYSWWAIGPLASCLMGSHPVGYMHVVFDGRFSLFVCCCMLLWWGWVRLPLSRLPSSGPPARSRSAYCQLRFLFWSRSQWRKENVMLETFLEYFVRASHGCCNCFFFFNIKDLLSSSIGLIEPILFLVLGFVFFFLKIWVLKTRTRLYSSAFWEEMNLPDY